MWNLLIVLVVVIVIFMFGSNIKFDSSQKNSSIIKQTTIDKIKNDADQQVKEARQLQKEVQEKLNH